MSGIVSMLGLIHKEVCHMKYLRTSLITAVCALTIFYLSCFIDFRLVLACSQFMCGICLLLCGLCNMAVLIRGMGFVFNNMSLVSASHKMVLYKGSVTDYAKFYMYNAKLLFTALLMFIMFILYPITVSNIRILLSV